MIHPYRNRWVDLDVPEVGRWTPTDSVSVVVPAKNAQDNLDRMLVALGRQTYPSALMEVAVVDDGSPTPLRAPDRTRDVPVRLHRQESDGRFGAGRARNRGAAETSGDIVIFLDSDIVAAPDVVERHARWHHVVPYAFVTGILTYVPVDEISPSELDALIVEDRLAGLLEPNETDAQHWRERTFSRTFDLVEESIDMFRVVIGGTMSLRRVLFDRIDGLRELGMRGIEDTEFGYRAQNAGALLVLDRTAKHWHQGGRFFDSRAAHAAKKAREPLLKELLPVPAYRPEPPRQSYQVPSIAVVVDGSNAVAIRDTVASFESCTRSDAALWLTDRANQPIGPEHRFATDLDEVDRIAVPFRLELTPGSCLAPDTLDLVLTRLRSELVGLVHYIDQDGVVLARAISSRAEARARAVDAAEHGCDERIGRLFGERWLPAASVGITSPAGSGEALEP